MLRRMRLVAVCLMACLVWGGVDPASAWAQPKAKQTKETLKGSGVAEYQSPHFIVRTDMTPDEAKDLLKRLETMLPLIEKYFEHKLPSIIGMYVVKNLDAWPREMLAQFDDGAIDSIESGGGVTISQTRSSVATGQIVDAKAIVYATADRGTPQHEAVHAYCILSFGRTGPTWYSEGMAEIGQYWTDKGLGVHCHDVVLKYLKSQEPKELTEIVDTNDVTGDSWQNYAWRWVLCHMLANNPNYAPRFKPLGLALLNGSRDVSFESVYGPMAKEINFEYQFFLRHIDDGYRADLCAWDWKAKYTPCKGATPFTARVDANRGWQPSRISVVADEEYDFSVSGAWRTTADNTPVDAEGAENGDGKLMGAIFDDYELSDPFPLGMYGTFKAPQSGNLMLRCADRWNELADNAGKMQVKIKLTGKGNPLPKGEFKPNELKSTTKKSSSSTATDKSDNKDEKKPEGKKSRDS